MKSHTERIDDIQFGDLRLIQNREWFCYGIDAVLAADFVRAKKGARIMDLGTGSGIIPIILTHKTQAEKIWGIEIQPEVAMLAQRNVDINHLASKIEILNINITQALLHCEKGSFDTVVCNPPYAKHGQGIKNSKDKKAIARHEIFAVFDDFVRIAADLLKPQGEFCLVHRPSRLADIIMACRIHKLEPKEIRFVYPRAAAAEPNIMLLRCKKYGGAELKYLKPLYVYEDDGTYTAELLQIYEK